MDSSKRPRDDEEAEEVARAKQRLQILLTPGFDWTNLSPEIFPSILANLSLVDLYRLCFVNPQFKNMLCSDEENDVTRRLFPAIYIGDFHPDLRGDGLAKAWNAFSYIHIKGLKHFGALYRRTAALILGQPVKDNPTVDLIDPLIPDLPLPRWQIARFTGASEFNSTTQLVTGLYSTDLWTEITGSQVLPTLHNVVPVHPTAMTALEKRRANHPIVNANFELISFVRSLTFQEPEFTKAQKIYGNRTDNWTTQSVQTFNGDVAHFNEYTPHLNIPINEPRKGDIRVVVFILKNGTFKDPKTLSQTEILFDFSATFDVASVSANVINDEKKNPGRLYTVISWHEAVIPGEGRFRYNVVHVFSAIDALGGEKYWNYENLRFGDAIEIRDKRFFFRYKGLYNQSARARLVTESRGLDIEKMTKMYWERFAQQEKKTRALTRLNVGEDLMIKTCHFEGKEYAVLYDKMGTRQHCEHVMEFELLQQWLETKTKLEDFSICPFCTQ